jgi:hypothetical protein
VQVLAGGSRYVAPASKTNTVLSFTNGTLVLNGGGLSAPLSNNVVFTANNKASGSNNLILTLDLASGLFNGSVKHPHTAKPILFKGAVFQNQNLGSGFFLQTNQSGHVYLGPVADADD